MPHSLPLASWTLQYYIPLDSTKTSQPPKSDTNHTPHLVQSACLPDAMDVQHISPMECMLSWAGPMSTVRTPRFADIFGPMVDPQALSLWTTTSYTTTIIQITITFNWSWNIERVQQRDMDISLATITAFWAWHNYT